MRPSDPGRFRHDLVLVDARLELAAARSLCRVLRTTGISAPLIVVLTEGGLAGLTAEWGVDDVILATAGPAEVEARFRLALGRTAVRRLSWRQLRPDWQPALARVGA